MSDNVELTELTEEQKQRVKDFWNNSDKGNPPGLKEWCEYVFGTGVDGRDKKAKLLKVYLSELSIKSPRPANEYLKKTDLVELTDEQKLYIQNHPEQSSLEIAQEIFNKPNLTPLDVECRVVQEYLKNNKPKDANNPRREALESYYPPRNFIETVARINRYIVSKIDKDKLSVQQRKDIECTQALLQDNRLLFLINSYQREDIRELFESSFIKYIHNKASDCTAEEVDQYINLASSIVTQMESMSELNQLKEQQGNFLSNSQTVPKSLGDRISSLEGNINELKSYQDKIIKALQGERNKRVENKIAENASVVALIAAWKKEEHRKKMINYAQMKEKAIREELTRLNSMDAIKAELFGIHSSEIVPPEQ